MKKWTIVLGTLVGLVLASPGWTDTPPEPQSAPKPVVTPKPVVAPKPAPRPVPAPAPVPQPGAPWMVSALGQGYLGVELVELTDDLRRFFQVPQDLGVMVSKVEEDSSAQEAGFRAGDIIVAVLGQEVSERWDLLRQVRQASGESVEIDIYREGTRLRLTVEVEESDEPLWMVPPTINIPDVNWEEMGRQLGNLNVEMKELGFKIGDFVVRIPEMVDWDDLSDEIEEALEEAASRLENAEFREIYAQELEDAMRHWSERHEEAMEKYEEVLEERLESLDEVEDIAEREKIAREIAFEEAKMGAALQEKIMRRENERARQIEARERDREERLRERLEELEKRLEELEEEIDDATMP